MLNFNRYQIEAVKAVFEIYNLFYKDDITFGEFIDNIVMLVPVNTGAITASKFDDEIWLDIYAPKFFARFELYNNILEVLKHMNATSINANIKNFPHMTKIYHQLGFNVQDNVATYRLDVCPCK